MKLYFPFSLSSTLLFLPLIIFFFLLKPFIRKLCNKHTEPCTIKKNLPPGPWKLPVLGNLLEIAGTLPHHAITNMAKKHGPIIHLQLGEISTIVISSARLAKEAFTTQDLSLADKPPFQAAKIFFYDFTDVGFSPYGNYWRQMRKICTLELLSSVKVQSFRSLREDEVGSFVESIRLLSGHPINLSKRISSLQNVIVCRATFGNGSFDQEQLIGIIVEILSSIGGFNIADLFPSYKLLHFLLGSTSKLQKMHQKLDNILDNIISDHIENLGARAETNEDLLDVLLRLKETGGLEFPITSSNIKAVIMDIFSAGTDTVSTTIQWAMAEMMKNTRVMHKAQAELRSVLKGKKNLHESDIQDLSYLKLIIKETLRLHGPGPLLPRKCRQECQVRGYTIPVNTQFMVNTWAIGRDPEYWNDPEIFEPERIDQKTCLQFNGSSFEYIPFGAGRRICPGMSFGIANVELTLAKLLYHFNWELPNEMKPKDLDMTETFGASVKLKNDLHVVAIHILLRCFD